MFCSRCGQSLEATAAFCSRCGAPVSATPAAADVSSLAPPAPTALGVHAARYGGFWRRFWAYVVDGIVLNILSLPITLTILYPILPYLGESDPSPEVAASLVLAMFLGSGLCAVMAWLYFAFMESSSKQATLGKLLVGVKVTDLEGRRIRFVRATGRYLGRILSGLILCIGYLMVAFTEKKQGLHDMLAGTLVVR